MGLDSVEIVLALEDTFHISIPVSEAEKIRTVADLHGLVASKLPVGERAPLANVVFYKLRRSMIQAFGVDRRAVLSTTLLEDLLPLDGRREAWCALDRLLEFHLPGLERPS